MGEYEYESNSHKARAERQAQENSKRVEKVVKGTVKTKKNEIRKLTDVFISEDVSNVKSYVLMDVLVPAIKKAISDIVTNGIDMILYGESGRSKKRSNSDYVSYRSYSDRDRNYDRDRYSRNSFDYEDFVFETRRDAEAVREQMDDLIERYGMVTVADLYDMADRTPPYTSNKYGWTSIRSADIVRSRNGYVIKLPRAMPID